MPFGETKFPTYEKTQYAINWLDQKVTDSLRAKIGEFSFEVEKRIMQGR
jgi:hypothetical protein